MRRWIMFLCAILPLAARPASLFDSTLFMPGPLAEAHADLETQCAKCHVDEGLAAGCLACHEAIATDLEHGQGFHGRASDGAECLSCHTDHEGRTAAITDLIEPTFPHERTDFALSGAHRGLACADCHGPIYHCPDDGSACSRGGPEGGRRVAKNVTPNACRQCHASPHDTALNEPCGACHDSERWSAVTFDHTATSFPLEGAHQRAACAACHDDLLFGGLKGHACASCHALDDAHHGHFGQACGDCHNTRDWAPDFDHDRTEFPLHGAHAELDCFACHGSKLQVLASGKVCVDCHRGTDPHQGALGTNCGDCHDEDQWRPARFDHVTTGFQLDGAHADTGCLDCHGNRRFTGAKSDCAFCHEAQNPHGDGLEQCDACHLTTSWRQAPGFDHDFTHFPLLGLHAAVPCFACHATRAFSSGGTACVDCHADEDAHEGVFGNRCDDCHASNGWLRVLFDHDAVGFPIDGAHTELGCKDCHRRARPPGAPIRPCGDCHRADDAHRGEFGSDCVRCHTTTSFTDVRVERLQ